MGYYLFWLAVIGLWTFLFYTKSHSGAWAFFIIGSFVLGLVWLKNLLNDKEAERKREERERDRINSIRDNFRTLQVRIITNSEQQPFAFRSLFDATTSFQGKPYTYPHICGLYFVVNGTIASPKATETITAFLSEFYNVYGHPTSSKKRIYINEESSESLAEKARIEAEREAHRQRIIDIALADIHGRTKEDVGDGGTALYIMSSTLGVKIGISDEPENRLGQVQTGHPALVTLSKMIWFFSRGDAALVEKTVHDFLKLRNVHAIGEWFNVKPGEASSTIGKIVQDLIQRGEVDSHRKEIQSKRISSDLDLSLALVISLPWNISRKGNEWLKLGDKNITIFPRQSRWSYVCAGEWSKKKFDTKKEAKVAALQLYLERYGEREFQADL